MNITHGAIRKLFAAAAALAVLAAVAPARGADALAAGFARPPPQTRPWCYWYWISDNLSKEGITRDLEAMARVGIGEALIGNIFLEDIPAGPVKVMTPEWWALVEHAIREGGRTGVDIGMFNCPGWSQSGGPWITPAQAMRHVAASETRVRGPVKFEQKLPAPKDPFQDVAVLAFPAPREDADTLAARSPRVTCTPAAAGAEKLADGDLSTSVEFPIKGGQGEIVIDIELPAPMTARSLQIHPSDEPFGADAVLEAADANGAFAVVRAFKCDRSNMSTGVGFLPRGPVTVSFAPATSSRFRLRFTGFHGRGRKVELAEIALSGAARLEAYVEKQLGKMHPTPLPMWDTYLWPTQAEPDDAGLAVPADAVRDLSKNLSADGTLRWDVPPGDWVILRTGMTPTGMKNAPASPEGRGLEVDKMNRALAQRHFDAFIGEVLRRMPAADRKAFKQVVADSYEMGSQNWTDGFDAQFRKRYGYDPKPWLPVLTGRLVGGADRSERFLWDLRRLVAERVATDYVGGLRDACRPHGLGLWLENYGHWGFPSEFLKYGSESDRIGGEFWVTGDLGAIELRAASSCANTYGKPFVSAEAFTGGPAFQNSPGALKARGDWSFCEGVNHFVLHVYIQQPWEDRKPGVNAWFGTEFNRHNTWFERSKTWIDYVRRSCWMLQQGTHAADVAYFIGEDAPKMTGVRRPELPPGRDFDCINSEVVEQRLRVKDGLLTLPHGMSYRALVLPDQDTMRPGMLRAVRDLVKDGATVVGRAPLRSPSMEGFPKCDDEVRALARELWGDAAGAPAGDRRVGKGRIVWGKTLDEVLAASAPAADFASSIRLRFIHRRLDDADLYFVANPKPEPVTAAAAFRVGERAPELWWPDSGRIESPAVYDTGGGTVRLPLQLGPNGSVFVVFRKPAAPAAQRIASVSHGGREVLGTTVRPPADDGPESPNNFTIAGWVKPADDTTLAAEANQGAGGLAHKRNEVFPAPHGGSFGGPEAAGCGLAVGRNGVCVYEHGANYFAPILVHAAPIGDWTHVTVVYRNGKPTLYLDGRPVRTGLQSAHTVYVSPGLTPGGAFRGAVAALEQIPRTLADAEVAARVKSSPRPVDGPALPPRFVRNESGRIEAQAAEAGEYVLTFADGKTQTLRVPDVAAPRELAGGWEVAFLDGRGAPERAAFEALVSWTQRPEDGIRCYSGRAVYRKSFDLPAAPGAASRLVLDLGEVRDVATVRLNGTELGTLWTAPWRMDITAAAKAGANRLEVEVINPWNNRLAGDAALPPEQRHSVILAPTVKAGAPLLPAGLLGPVTLRTVAVTEAP